MPHQEGVRGTDCKNYRLTLWSRLVTCCVSGHQWLDLFSALKMAKFLIRLDLLGESTEVAVLGRHQSVSRLTAGDIVAQGTLPFADVGAHTLLYDAHVPDSVGSEIMLF